MDRDRIEELTDELVKERSMEALERLTGSSNDRVLAALVECAGDIIESEVTQDEDDTIIEEIQSHLVKCAELAPLVEALDSKRPSVKEFVLGCLSEIGDIGAAEAMIAKLEDEEPAVRDAAAEHLSLLTDNDLGVDPVAWRRWLEEQGAIAKQREIDEREDSKARAKAKTKVLDVRIDEDETDDDEGPAKPAARAKADDDDDDDRPSRRSRDEDDDDLGGESDGDDD